MYARPQLEDGDASTFGVSGKLWRVALVMYDRRSRSLWSQVDGHAWAGPMTGQTLTKIPSQVSTWASWKDQNPDTLVLVKPAIERSPYSSYFERASWVGLPWTRGGRDDRLPAKTLVIGIELNDSGALAITTEQLEGQGWSSGEVAGLPILVLAPQDPRSALAYVRRIGNRELEFVTSSEGHLVDQRTGSRWDWTTGAAISGPLAGEKLPPLQTTPIYWATWTAFHPETVLW